MNTRVASAIACIAASTAASTGYAQKTTVITETTTTDTPAPHVAFGQAGSLAISADRLTGFGWSQYKLAPTGGGPDITLNTTQVSLLSSMVVANATLVNGIKVVNPLAMPRAGLDYFVTENLSIGGAATGWYFASSGDGDTLNPRQVGFAVLPRLGYAFQLGDGIALWPRISADIAYAVIGKNTDPVQLKGLLFSLTFGVPLVINLSKQFAMTLTPSFDFPLLGELTKQGGADVGKLLMMNAGATLGIVGWL